MTNTPHHQHTTHLLQTLLDYLPQPHTTQTANTPGPTPGQRERCTRCDTTGRVHGDLPCQACRTLKARSDEQGGRWSAFAVRHGCHLCLACNGTGHRTTRNGDHIDEMLTQGRTDQHDKAYERAEYRRRQETEIHRLGLLADVRAGGEAEDWWLAAAERRRVRLWAGTGHGLVWARLEVLRALAPNRYRLVFRVLVYGEPVVLSGRMVERLGETVDWIGEVLPAGVGGGVVVRVVRGRKGVAVRVRGDRDERVRAVVRLEGLSVREAGERFGLSKSLVARIVRAGGGSA